MTKNPSHGAERLLRIWVVFVFFAMPAVPGGFFLSGAEEYQPTKEEQFFIDNYTKKEYNIPMRDGVKLFTAVYSPKDTGEKYPILMWRTPYSLEFYGKNKYKTYRWGSWHHLTKEKYIIVFQDVRGTFMSEGEFVQMRPQIPAKKGKKDIDESSDTYDTIDWLVKNIPNNNGKAGMWGISYPGFYAAVGAIDAHPALKAVSPQAPIADWFVGDDFHHNGVLSISPMFSFLYMVGQPRNGPSKTWSPPFDFPTPDGYKFFLDLGPLPNINKKYYKGNIAFWNQMAQHGSYDAYWQSRSSLPHLKNITPAALVVGGWFDAENCYGALETYRAIEKLSPGADNFLVMGPWFHGGWVRSDGSRLGDVPFGSGTSDYYVKNIEVPFFNYYLKGKGKKDFAEARVFETGGNRWRTYAQWPPKQAKEAKLFFRTRGGLSFSSPENSGEVFDEYVSDPAKPVPFNPRISTAIERKDQVADQRFAARRPDVLVYETEPLQEDVTVLGKIQAELFVSTTGTDSDWVVKLIDVFPGDAKGADDVPMGDYQMMVRGEIMRGKFRESLEKPLAMEPGKVTRVVFSLNDVNHTFKKGHRIMVHVQSSWFPLFDRNPQTFTDIYSAAAELFKKATQRVYISKQYPSGLRVKTL